MIFVVFIAPEQICSGGRVGIGVGLADEGEELKCASLSDRYIDDGLDKSAPTRLVLDDVAVVEMLH